MMTQHEVCLWLLSQGATRVSDQFRTQGTKCFELGLLTDAPPCSCNVRPPCLYVAVYPDLPAYLSASEGRVEFEVYGQAGDGRWLRAIIYSILREEVEALLPDVRATATAVWTAFVHSLAHRVVTEEGA